MPAYIVGPQIYPPVPIMISGLNSFIILFIVKILKNVLTQRTKLFIDTSLKSPYALIFFKLYPAFGTSSFSNP